MGKGSVIPSWLTGCILCAVLFAACSKNNVEPEREMLGKQIDTLTVYSSKMHREIEVTVIKPETYTPSVHYPVVYLLNCAGESNKMWLKYMPEIVELANTSKFIFVCPDGGTRSWYIDSPVDPDSQYESFIIDDVLPAIEGSYAVISDRDARFISGVSMGGHGALYLAIRNKHLFSACGSMIGGMDLCYEPDRFGIDLILGDYATYADRWKANSCMTLVEGLENKELSILFDSSPDDFFYAANVKLSEKLWAMGIEHTFSVRRGGHDVYYIRQALPFHILFFMDVYRSK